MTGRPLSRTRRRECFHRLRHGANAHLELLHARHGLVEHGLFVEQAEQATQGMVLDQFTTQKQVFGNGHGRGYGQVLVHGLNARTAGIDR